ncbi:hypothetical protein D9M73_243080 [compost metagenome]
MGGAVSLEMNLQPIAADTQPVAFLKAPWKVLSKTPAIVVEVGSVAVIDDTELALHPADLAVDWRNGLIAVDDKPTGPFAADGAAPAIEPVTGNDAMLQLIEVGDAQGQCAHERPLKRTTGLISPCRSSTKLVQPR